MSYCLNPDCQKPTVNPAGTIFCQSCGTKLLLRERYRVLKLIGQGGFGRTFSGVDEDKPSKPRCAIKQFFPQAQGTNTAQKAAELFEQEAVRLDELGKHSQIPELLAHFTQDSRQYIVQEFIDGQNLADELAETGGFAEEQILSLLSDLLPVLQFIHVGQVIHRDIKPENIIRRRADGKLVLVDFGAAKYATGTALAKTGTTIGTAIYSAPEQAFGKAIFASDIYSLGVTCIHLLTQREPFDLYDAIESEFAWQHLVKKPVSDRLANILQKMTQHSPKQRYQSAAEVLEDLKRQAHQATAVSPVTPAQPPAQPPSLAAPLTSLDIEAELMAMKAKLNPQPPSQTVSEIEVKAQNVYSNQTWRCVKTLTGHFKDVNSVVISPDGEILASGGDDNTINLWKLKTVKLIRSVTTSAKIWTLAISPDGQILASGDLKNTLMTQNLYTGSNCRFFFSQSSSMYSHSGYVYAVAFTPNGKTLASGSADSTVRLWDVSTGSLLNTLTGHSDTVWSIAISPDGQTLASGSADTTIHLWNLTTRKVSAILQGHRGSVNDVAISPDGQTLVSGSRDKTVKIWKLATGELINTLEGHTDSIFSLAISPDGKTLASGSKDTTIKLWNLHAGELLCTLSEHSAAVKSLAFSPDGQTLVSGSWDKTIKIWQVI